MISLLFNIIKLFCKSPLTGLKLLTFRRVVNFLSLIATRGKEFHTHKMRYQSIFGEYQEKEENIPYIRPTGRHDIIFFPMIDWNFRTQRPQHIARGLAKDYGRVFYLACNPLIASSSLPYSVDMVDSEFAIIMQISNGANRLPDLFHDQLTPKEIEGYVASFEKMYFDFEITDAIAIVQHPFWTPLIEALPFQSLIYDCIDLHEGFTNRNCEHLENLENRLAEKADHVVVTSTDLKHRIKASPPPIIIRNGCEFERFSSPRKKEIRDHITIGYVGAVSSWFDLDMLYHAATARPDFQFDIYGAIEDGILLQNVPRNVTFHGEVAYDDVPLIMSTFDVAIIPFKITALTKAVNPVKIYEYAAAGKTIISTALPEVELIKSIDLFIARSNEEFLDCLDQSIKKPVNIESIKRQRVWAQEQDWSNRVSEFLQLMPPAYPKK